MIKIPLQIKLKREIHRKIAYAQDLIDFEPEKFGGYPDLLKKFLKT